MSNGVTMRQLATLRVELSPEILVDQPRPKLTETPPQFTKDAGVLTSLMPSPPETAEEIAKLNSALSVLSSNVPRGDGSLYTGGQISTNYWLLVVWGIASLGWSCGFGLAREWSRRDGYEKYSDKNFSEGWDSYKPGRKQRIGIGSVYKLAQHYGWSWKQSANDTVHFTDANSFLQQEATNEPRYKVKNSTDIGNVPNMRWLIKGVLPTKGVAVIFGPSGSGKSFLALDMAAAIAGASDE
jgi:hypothetical protein